MSSQDSKYEDSDQQLKSNGEPFTHIGEVKITQTMFGKVKIEVAGQPDNESRSWLLPAISVIVIAAAAWFGWVATHKAETSPSAVPSPSLSADAQAGAPAEVSKSNDAPQEKTNSNVASQQNPPQQVKGKERMATKPVESKPSRSGKPKAETADTSNKAAMTHAETQQQTQERPPSPPEAPALTPPPAAQP